MIGKFDNIFDSDDMTDEILTGEEAVAAIAYLTSFAAHNGDVEEENLVETLWELEIFALYSEEQLSDIFDKIITISEEDGVGALFNAAYDIIPDELITDAFAAAIIILLESGELSTHSRKVLKELEKALEISSEDAVAIIDAVLTEFSPTNEDEGNRLWYESPEGNFSVPIPVDPQKGGKVEEEDSCVKFVDDFGTLFRIDYVPFTAGMDDQMEAVGDRTFLQGFLDNYVSEGILSYFSGSQVLHEG
ncbi:MAG: tellurite resistance TerB family protein, partial [Microcoleaceae cyanobacterium]